MVNDSAYNKSMSSEGIRNLSQKLNQLKRQIQAERVLSIKERVEKNKKDLESHVSRLTSATSNRSEENASDKLFSSMQNPLSKFAGFSSPSLRDKDWENGQEVVLANGIKLPSVERIPRYTTWIFLDRNQRMAEDQSVVGRRRIYYDHRERETLICSDDSDEESVELGEEKHEFSEGEDRIIWIIVQEHGEDDEVLSSVSEFIGVFTMEIQERYATLKENREKEAQSLRYTGESRSQCGLSLEKSLGATLDSFDNLFCRRCLVFDCHLHGCSQTIIHPSEKQPWSGNEDDRNPCSDQCYLWGMKSGNSGEKERTAFSSNVKEPGTTPNTDLLLDDRHSSQMVTFSSPELICSSEAKTDPPKPDTLSVTEHKHETLRKGYESEQTTAVLDDSVHVSSDIQEFPRNSQKKSASGIVAASNELMQNMDHVSSLKSRHGAPNENELHMTNKHKAEGSSKNGAKNVNEVIELNQSSSSSGLERASNVSEWKPIEKELYLKGVEIFGKNSCLIARNVLSGLKTCAEVSSYMCDNRASVSHRSTAANFSGEENEEARTDLVVQERPRLFRRRGRARKLKYSWKSAGHPSFWKRIANSKNRCLKLYTPCGCKPTCGKDCPCLSNETCCEKYCGCSKSCKNRFRGCHCAKSQCRSRQCPCFAAGRECDPDVCRNCWVSCGGGSLGEPPRQGDGQCGNTRLLLRQQQRILLAKSDLTGWGAFVKNSVEKNEYLGEYTGELISHTEADIRGKIYDRFVLDAFRKGDKLKFANHSPKPNCYAKVTLVAGDHRVGIFAKECIEAREELFYDYQYGPSCAPVWARKPEGSKRDGSKREDSSVSRGRAKKYKSF